MELLQKNTFLFLIGILFLGTALRFIGLGNNSFVADEFLDMNSAYGYHQTGKWQAWDFNFEKPAEMNLNVARDERAWVYKWQVAQLFQFLPPTEGVARFVSALWGILAIGMIFWSALIFTQKKEISLLAAFLCAVSISALIFSRRLRMYAMFFPLYLGAVTTLYAFYEREYRGKIALFQTVWKKYGINVIFLVPTLVLVGLASATHQLTPHLFLSLGLYLVIQATLVWRRQKSWRNKYSLSLLLALVALIGILSVAPRLIGSFTRELSFFDDHFSYIGYVLLDYAAPFLGACIGLMGLFFHWKHFPYS